MSTSSQTNQGYRFVERGHGDITADVVDDQELGTVLWVQTNANGCYVKPERVGELATGLQSAVAVQPAESDRLSPGREAEIREQFASWPAHATIPLLLAELAAVRNERGEVERYAALLEADLCHCEPLREGDQYLHAADCPVVEHQQAAGGAR